MQPITVNLTVRLFTHSNWADFLKPCLISPCCAIIEFHHALKHEKSCLILFQSSSIQFQLVLKQVKPVQNQFSFSFWYSLLITCLHSVLIGGVKISSCFASSNPIPTCFHIVLIRGVKISACCALKNFDNFILIFKLDPPLTWYRHHVCDEIRRFFQLNSNLFAPYLDIRAVY